MKKIVLAIIFLFSALFSTSQSLSLEWVKQMGGVDDDVAYSIAIDELGNVYTTGYIRDTADFDPGVGTFDLNVTDGQYVFVSKLDSLGNLIWAKAIGGLKSFDVGYSIALDTLANVYITGYFNATVDFDPGPDTFNLTAIGGTSNDIFIAKLDSAGNFAWAKQFGGPAYEQGLSITVDLDGDVYTTGYFQGTVDFDPGVGVFNLTASVGQAIFISKLDALGNFVWAKNITGTPSAFSINIGNSIKVDSDYNVYITGQFGGTFDFDPNAGTYNLTSNCQDDIFILKLDSLGSFVWAKNIGGTLSYAQNEGKSMALDSFANIYVSGYFYGNTDFDPGTGTFNLNNTTGGTDAFILKLDSFGSFIWAKNIGGTMPLQSNAIVSDEVGNIYTTGIFQGTADFNPGVGTFNLTSSLAQDVFILKLDASGIFIWAGSMSGSATSEVASYSIACDNYDNIYTTGLFYDTIDFELSGGIFNLITTSAGYYDVFVHKIGMGTSEVSIDENLTENGILIYPNPSNNFIEIETTLNYYSLSIFNIMGKLIYKEKATQNKTRIDISNYSNGIYFLQLATEDKIISKKFIKE